jgi:hypothetical protein
MLKISGAIVLSRFVTRDISIFDNFPFSLLAHSVEFSMINIELATLTLESVAVCEN